MALVYTTTTKTVDGLVALAPESAATNSFGPKPSAGEQNTNAFVYRLL
jgi:hypothetical protein